MPLTTPVRDGGEILSDTGDRAINVQYNFNAVGPDYFRTMQIPIISGRAFVDSDRKGAPAVVIVNENLARLLFGSGGAVGHKIRLPDKREAWVVGIARNSMYFVMDEENPLALYRPWGQHEPDRFAHFLVRTKGAPAAVSREVNRTLEDLDPAATVETKTMRDASRFVLLPSRVGAAVLGTMALLGVALAAAGLYGVLVYNVSRRFREIGVRMALGATPANILGMVAGESARVTAAGTLIGLGLSAFAVRPLAMFLVAGVRPDDPMNFLAVGCGLALVAALATVSPIFRALRVDPVVALRHE